MTKYLKRLELEEEIVEGRKEWIENQGATLRTRFVFLRDTFVFGNVLERSPHAAVYFHWRQNSNFRNPILDWKRTILI